ncbi:MAG: sigma-70 factor domain-containing protein, partial [Candidatus Aminicenantaceae bacterium]
MSNTTTKYFDDPDISRILTRILEDQGGFYKIEQKSGSGQDPELATTTDPVKLYMREMGSIFLLSRSEEVMYAKRIEKGENVIINALCNTPFILGEIMHLEESLKSDPNVGRRYFELSEEDMGREGYQQKIEEIHSTFKKIREIAGHLERLTGKKASSFVRGRHVIRIKRLICGLDIRPKAMDEIIDHIHLKLKKDAEKSGPRSQSREARAILQSIA